MRNHAMVQLTIRIHIYPTSILIRCIVGDCTVIHLRIIHIHAAGRVALVIGELTAVHHRPIHIGTGASATGSVVRDRAVPQVGGVRVVFTVQTAATVFGIVLRDRTMVQDDPTLQAGTAAIIVVHIAILQGEAVPRRTDIEDRWLVEHTLVVLAVQNGGVVLKVTLAQIVVFRLVTRKAAIDIHSFRHREGIIGDTVSVIGALCHPYRDFLP